MNGLPTAHRRSIIEALRRGPRRRDIVDHGRTNQAQAHFTALFTGTGVSRTAIDTAFGDLAKSLKDSNATPSDLKTLKADRDAIDADSKNVKWDVWGGIAGRPGVFPVLRGAQPPKPSSGLPAKQTHSHNKAHPKPTSDHKTKHPKPATHVHKPAAKPAVPHVTTAHGHKTTHKGK